MIDPRILGNLPESPPEKKETPAPRPETEAEVLIGPHLRPQVEQLYQKDIRAVSAFFARKQITFERFQDYLEVKNDPKQYRGKDIELLEAEFDYAKSKKYQDNMASNLSIGSRTVVAYYEFVQRRRLQDAGAGKNIDEAIYELAAEEIKSGVALERLRDTVEGDPEIRREMIKRAQSELKARRAKAREQAEKAEIKTLMKNINKGISDEELSMHTTWMYLQQEKGMTPEEASEALPEYHRMSKKELNEIMAKWEAEEKDPAPEEKSKNWFQKLFKR